MRRKLVSRVIAAYRREGQKPETRSAILADRQSGYGKQFECVGTWRKGKRARLGIL